MCFTVRHVCCNILASFAILHSDDLGQQEPKISLSVNMKLNYSSWTAKEME